MAFHRAIRGATDLWMGTVEMASVSSVAWVAAAEGFGVAKGVGVA